MPFKALFVNLAKNRGDYFMFFSRLQLCCSEQGIKLSPLLDELGISRGSIGRWRSGTLPNGETLLKLASRLNCSVDYLLGLEEQKEKPTPKEGSGLTDDQRYLIDAIYNMSAANVKKLRIIVDQVIAEREK